MDVVLEPFVLHIHNCLKQTRMTFALYAWSKTKDTANKWSTPRAFNIQWITTDYQCWFSWLRFLLCMCWKERTRKLESKQGLTVAYVNVPFAIVSVLGIKTWKVIEVSHIKVRHYICDLPVTGVSIIRTSVTHDCSFVVAVSKKEILGNRQAGIGDRCLQECPAAII